MSALATNRYIYGNVTDWWNAVRNAVLQGAVTASDGTTDVTFEIDEWSGHPLIRMHWDAGGIYTTDWDYVLECVLSSAGAPVEMILGAPGSSGSAYGEGSGFPEDLADYFFAVMEAYAVQALQPFVLAVTGESLTLWVTELSTDADTSAVTAGVVLSVPTDIARVYAIAQSITFNAVVYTPPSPAVSQYSAGTRSIIGQPTATSAGSADLNRIADALEVISLQDVEVSINHGAAMYSVKGKITTG